MALYFYFNETTGDLVYSDQATYDAEGYTSLGQQTKKDPAKASDWIFHSKRGGIQTITKDPNLSERIDVLTSMKEMFSICTVLTSIDLSGFDMSNVTDMNGAFGGCESLTSLDLDGLDTSSVTDMFGMFSGSTDLTSLDLSGLDTSNVTDMGQMFYACYALPSLDLSGFDTSNVTGMHEMFASCDALSSLDLGSFDTSNVTDVGNMFDECPNLRIIDISPNMSNVLSELPNEYWYPATGGEQVAKANLTAGTWVRDQKDFELLTNIVQQAQMAQSINHRINKLNKKVNEISSGSLSGSNVDIVKVTEHKTSYTKDTLEAVVDGTGKVTAMYFITAE